MISLAVSPALAPGKAAPYVIAAYMVFLAVVLIYIGIMARRLLRTQRDLADLKRQVELREAVEAGSDTAREREHVG